MVRTESGGNALPRLTSALRLDLQARGLRDFGERRAGLELVEHFGRLGAQNVGDLVVPPARFELVFDLVERPFPLGRNARHFVPDIAAGDLQRIVLDADLGRERGGEQALGLRNAAHRLARRADALAVHLEGPYRKLQIGRSLGQWPADRTLVLDLVVERKNLGPGALVRKVFPELVAHFAERPNLLRFDLQHADEHGSKSSFDRRAYLVLLEREGRGSDRLVDHRSPCQRAEVDFLFAQLLFLCDIEERFTLGDPVGRRLRVLRIVEDDLLERPALRGEITRAAIFVGLLHVGIGDCRPHRLFAGQQRQHDDLAILGSAEQRLALLEIFRELLGRRVGNFPGLRPLEQDVFDRTLLVLIALGGFHRGFRQLRSSEDGAGQLPPQYQAALFVDEAPLGDLVVAQHRLEAHAVELAGRAEQIRIGRDPARHLGIGDAEPQRLRALVDRRFANELPHQLLVEAHAARLIEGDRAAELPAKLLQPLAVELTELLDGDLGPADPRQARAAKAAENVADAPDREADRDQAEHDAHDDSAEPIGGGGANTSKHGDVSG